MYESDKLRDHLNQKLCNLTHSIMVKDVSTTEINRNLDYFAQEARRLAARVCAEVHVASMLMVRESTVKVDQMERESDRLKAERNDLRRRMHDARQQAKKTSDSEIDKLVKEFTK